MTTSTLQWRIGRDQVLKVLAGSLTPATLAEVISDLQANDQNSDDDQQVADHAEAVFWKQLSCMVGDDDAQSLVKRGLGDGNPVGTVQEIVQRLAATSLERLGDLEEFDRIGQLIAAARMAFPDTAQGR